MVRLIIILMVALVSMGRTMKVMVTKFNMTSDRHPKTPITMTDKEYLPVNFTDKIDKTVLQEMESSRRHIDKVYSGHQDGMRLTTSNSSHLARNHLNKTKFNVTQILDIVNLHNDIRARVNPPAADMAYMEWSDELASMAQMWATGCKFKRGIPLGGESKKVGQNLFWTSRRNKNNAVEAVKQWYREKRNYDLLLPGCVPTKTCHHYTQIIWARTKYVGCGIGNCNKRNSLVVCYYLPSAKRASQPAYTIGSQCSRCPESADGGLCFNGTCVSRKQCNDYQLNCSCPLKCHNCGKLDKDTCTCKCTKGWGGLDCSDTTSMNPKEEVINRTCCSGKVCTSGYVLDKHCNCVVKCPGQLCYKGHGKDLTRKLTTGTSSVKKTNDRSRNHIFAPLVRRKRQKGPITHVPSTTEDYYADIPFYDYYDDYPSPSSHPRKSNLFRSYFHVVTIIITTIHLLGLRI